VAEVTETGSMISRAVTKVPEDPKELNKFLLKVLNQHYRDIKTLFDTCTDCDRYEKLMRDRESA